MTDAPETIWVGSDICHDDFGPEPNIWKDEASSYETDIKYTRADVAQARIAELEGVVKWYGEQARLARLIHSEGDEGRHAIHMDGGSRSRAALKAKP
jgi:hypothetical protein